MKKQILVLSIVLGACTLTAQTTQPDKQKSTQQKGTQKEKDQTGTEQNGTQKKGNHQDGTQKGNYDQNGQQKGMRQSGSEDSDYKGSITPPSPVNDKFNSEYPNMSPTWHMDGENYSAEYMDKSSNMGKNVVFDKYGNMIRTDNELSPDGLNYPAAIGDYHSKNFPNEGYRVWQTDDGKGNKWYYTKRKNGMIWFDKDGKLYPGKQTKAEDKTKK